MVDSVLGVRLERQNRVLFVSDLLDGTVHYPYGAEDVLVAGFDAVGAGTTSVPAGARNELLDPVEVELPPLIVHLGYNYNSGRIISRGAEPIIV